MVNTLFTLVVLVFTCMTAYLAHAFSFTDSTLGGWLPFLFLTLGPVTMALLGWINGKSHA